MPQVIIRVLLALAALAVAAPFLVSSLYVDQRGIVIPGKVQNKSETVTVNYSGWKRTSEVTIQYTPPDTYGLTYFVVTLPPDRYDELHTGSTVRLHYLLRRDTPALPMAGGLRQMHALPVVRLADERAFSSLRANANIVFAAAAVLFILFLLRRFLPRHLFWWIFGIGAASGIVIMLIQEFPKPTPRPVAGLQTTSGRVKSVGRIETLFESSDGGFDATQPVDVVGIEFIPAGRTEPVLAVDLIDSESLPGLKENAAVPIEYEAQSPRTAYIQGATRKFVSRNLTGIVKEVVLGLLLFAVLGAILYFISRGWRLLLRSRGL